MNAKFFTLVTIAGSALLLLGCQGCSEPGGNADPGTAETQTQIDGTSTGSTTHETTAGSDMDGTDPSTTPTDSATQTEKPTSSGSQDTNTSGTGSTSDTETDTDTDTSPFPPGCEIVSRSNAITWEGSEAMDAGRIVWSEYNYDKEVPELKMKDLHSKEVTVLVSDPNWENRSGIYGNRVFFDEELTPGDATTREVFFIDIASTTKQKHRLTEDDCSDGQSLGGSGFVVYTKSCRSSKTIALHYTNLTTLESREIVPDAVAPPGGAGRAFDGERYVVWSWRDSSLADDFLKLYLFDIQNPGAPVVITPMGYGQHSPIVAHGKVYSATAERNSLDKKGLEIMMYDLETKATKWVVQRPYDQIPGDADGFVLAYQNTEETGKHIFESSGKSHVELIDLETGTVRKVTKSLSSYHGLAVSGKYLAFIVSLGANAGTLVACDLKAAGFMGEDGHLIPAS